MASSRTSIGNEALALIRATNGFNNIDTDNEPNAKAARTFLDEHILELMSEYEWSSFSKTFALGDITDSEPPPVDWLYRYSFPEDCLVPRQILIAGSVRNQTPIPFRTELLPDGSARSILTNSPSATLRYTSSSYSDLVQNWEHWFRRAVTYRLAASLAVAVKEKPGIQEAMMGMYIDAMRMARYIDTSSGFQADSNDSQLPSATRSRSGGAGTRTRTNQGIYNV